MALLIFYAESKPASEVSQMLVMLVSHPVNDPIIYFNARYKATEKVSLMLAKT